MNPNYTPGAGRLVTDRFDFQKHVDGYNARHDASQIDLDPPVVIGTTKNNVQEAIVSLASIVSPPEIPDATTLAKGIVRLNGDLAGTASTVIVSGLRGYPVSTLPPSLNNILSWDGYNWLPVANTNSFTASGDLGGNNTFQQVNSLTGLTTGSVNSVVVNSGSIITYNSNNTPLLTQNNKTSGNGADFTLRAQTTTGSANNGGNLILAGGKGGSSGLRGGVKLQLTNAIDNTYPSILTGITATNMVQATEVAAGRRVLSLVHSSDLNTGDMPANTGDMVIYVRNAATAPTTGIPGNGAILYADSGSLWVKHGDSNQFAIGTPSNPSIWGPTGSQRIEARATATSINSVMDMYTYPLPLNTTALIQATIIGLQDGYAQAYQCKINMGYARAVGGPVGLTSPSGVQFNIERYTSDFPSWTITKPTIAAVGNNIVIYSGKIALSGNDLTIDWFATIEITTLTG